MSGFAERMAALRLRFRERTGKDRFTLLAALATRDRQQLARTSHGLAGAAGIFGFGALGDAAQRIEDALDSDEPWSTIESHCDGLLAMIESATADA